MNPDSHGSPPPAPRGSAIRGTLPLVLLLGIVIGLAAAPLGAYLVHRERAARVRGLAERAEIVLAAAASLAASHFLDRNLIELALLPRLTATMPEALFMTITGPAVRGEDHDAAVLDARDPRADDGGLPAMAGHEFLWATSDPDIDAKLLDGSFSLGSAGTLRISDEVSPLLSRLAERLDRDCREQLSDLAAESDRLAAEALELVLLGASRSTQLLALSQEAGLLQVRIAAVLETLGDVTASVPVLEAGDLAASYTFYRPILYRRRGDSGCFRGVVRLGVSAQGLKQELAAQNRTILVRTGLVALTALLAGTGGAVLLGRRRGPWRG